ALFVDSKAEKDDPRTATIQTAQTSMRIMFYGGRGAARVTFDEQGTLPRIVEKEGNRFLTTTIFVKYNYAVTDDRNDLISIITAAIPNGMLQTYYNPNAGDTIWRVGRHAPTLGEAFRVRLVFQKLQDKRRWRVQQIPMAPAPFTWQQ
ncbi:MAG: SfiI family type II restriction endonuclease, partial [Desulfobaccales bacterium]